MNIQLLTPIQRVNRVSLGSVVILFTMLVNYSPLGLLATLPLLATYPIFAGIYGYDPVRHFLVTQTRELKTVVVDTFHKVFGPRHGPHHH